MLMIMKRVGAWVYSVRKGQSFELERQKQDMIGYVECEPLHSLK